MNADSSINKLQDHRFENLVTKEYLYHPLHKKFIEENMHLWGKVQVIDSQEPAA